MVKNKENGITWFQINNWVPIIVTSVLISGSFMVMKSDMRIANRNIELLLAGQTKLIEQYENVQSRLGKCELSLGIINSKLEIGTNKL